MINQQNITSLYIACVCWSQHLFPQHTYIIQHPYCVLHGIKQNNAKQYQQWDDLLHLIRPPKTPIKGPKKYPFGPLVHIVQVTNCRSLEASEAKPRSPARCDLRNMMLMKIWQIIWVIYITTVHHIIIWYHISVCITGNLYYEYLL